MSKEARIGLGGARWRATGFTALARPAAVGLLVASGLTGGPGVAVAAAQAAAADGAFTAD